MPKHISLLVEPTLGAQFVHGLGNGSDLRVLREALETSRLPVRDPWPADLEAAPVGHTRALKLIHYYSTSRLGVPASNF